MQHRIANRIAKGASHSGCPNLFRPSPFQYAGTFGQNGAGRHDIINNNDIATSDVGRTDAAECALHVLQPLFAFMVTTFMFAIRNCTCGEVGDVVRRGITNPAIIGGKNRKETADYFCQTPGEDSTSLPALQSSNSG